MLLFVACAPPTNTPPLFTEPVPTKTTALASTPIPTQELSLVSTPTRSVVESSAPERDAFSRICTPLEGISLSQLQGMVSNPFHPPLSGSDDPHQGIDLADVDLNGVARGGHPVSAVLAGKVAAIIRDRFPYGNAVLLETTLESLPTEWINQLDLPAPGVSLETVQTLTCPALSSDPGWDLEIISLYLLYAHLQAMPLLQPGEHVNCGQVIGAIGSSGNALNPHLHLEVRTGPAGTRFASMAHYDLSATLNEMAAYCAWRVSGSFPVVDPMRLLSLSP